MSNKTRMEVRVEKELKDDFKIFIIKENIRSLADCGGTLLKTFFWSFSNVGRDELDEIGIIKKREIIDLSKYPVKLLRFFSNAVLNELSHKYGETHPEFIEHIKTVIADAAKIMEGET